jgi:hypothetical protein
VASSCVTGGASTAANPELCRYTTLSRCAASSSSPTGARSPIVRWSRPAAPSAWVTSPNARSQSIRMQAEPATANACARWVATNVQPAPPRAACTAITVASRSGTRRAEPIDAT